MPDVRRRELIALLGGAALAWPIAARAQQAAMPVIGYLSSLAQDVSVQFDAAFRRGLSEMGYIEGQNVSIEYHWITDSYDPLPRMAADLVERHVAVICALGPQYAPLDHRQYSRPKPRQRVFPSFLSPALIRSNSALSRASTDQAETSPASGLSAPCWRKKDCS